MPIVKCLVCSERFYTKPNWIKIGRGKYCSVFCAGKSRRKGRNTKCALCTREVYKSLKSIKSSKSGKLFCGKRCSIQWHNSYYVQERHSNWKFGEFSYKRNVIRNKIKAYCRLCNITDKRILLIHHLDENRKNNKLDNLTWLCYNCHFLVHRYKGYRNALKKVYQKTHAANHMQKM